MAEKQEKEKPLEKMTAKELRELALDIDGIVGVHSMNKPELIGAIKEARGIVDDSKRKVDAGTIRGLKKRIKDLRLEQDKAREAGDDKMVGINRRRISRLKKKTRRLAAG
jgi:hypothetical protein